MQKNLTQGSVWKNILFFSLPYLLSNFLQTLYGMADLYFAGQYNHSDVITAVSVGSQIMHMVTVIIVGLAMGTTVMVSQCIGSGKKEQISDYIGNTVVLFCGTALIVTLGLSLLVRPIVNVMDTPVESVEETVKYLRICFLGIPFITAYNVISAVFRGLGDTKSPMIFVAIACVINIGLDYLFMGPMTMKASGAAFATVIAQTVSVIIALIAMRFGRLGVRITAESLRPRAEYISRLLGIGVPVALQDGFIQISFLVITAIANGRGVEMAAAVGIVEKIICFIFLVPSSILAAISAIAAQNNGAGLHDRGRKTLGIGILICVVFGLLCGVVSNICPELWVGFFDKESSVRIYGAQYLRAYSFDCALAGIHFCFSGYFCAYNRSVYSFIHNLISVLVFRIPGAYLATKFFPDTLFPMGMAAPAGSLASALICLVMYLGLQRSIQSGRFSGTNG